MNKNLENKDTAVIDGQLMAKMALGGAAQLRSNAEEVNRLNVFPVPDGDTGDNMQMTIESGIAAIENVDTNDLAQVMKFLSHGMLLGARGNSGVILSQFFAGISKGLESSEEADAATLGHALEVGVHQAYTSVMTPTEGTILTVAREAVEYAVHRITPKSTIRSLFSDLVKEMHASLDRTPEILPVLKEAGVVDSGGAGLFYIIDGFNRVLNGEELESPHFISEKSKATVDLSAFGPDSEMTYGYCTEVLLRLQNKKTDIENFDLDALKAFLGGIGDSVVAFRTDSVVKVHVHTLTPEAVIAHLRKFGEMLTVKIENMSLQHSETIAEEKKAEKKKYGIVSVANGPGLEKVFFELGADEVIRGGQTQNPSAGDFFKAFSKINADNIFVFPNNGNILMAAQQAAQMYEGADVYVIPSKNIGTGYVGVSSINTEIPRPKEIIAEVEAAMLRVTSGYISPSIRDADMNGVHIENGDTIGIVGKEIVIAKKERRDASHGLADILLSDGDKLMLTVFCGKDADESERSELGDWLCENYPDIEIYFIDGGQDIYPFIFVAE
ncbi:MAG: DAK2 domain-containing protein [Ruminococcaceae bacterium]|nr:DAK2 domain-containing protein [Oscillospiraceae bacterium]